MNRALLLALLLAGCATAPPAPPPVMESAKALEPQRIPVVVPCLTAEHIPPRPPTMMQGRSGWHNEVAAAIDLANLDVYVIESQSRMWGCVKSFEEGKKP